MFGNLASKSNAYAELSNALQERFAPPNQTDLYRVQLKERKQKATESLTELGQDIWRLINLAYPTAPADLRETLAKEQFIDALVSSDMRLRIKQARPTSLNMAVRHAVELEAFNKAERKHLEGQGFMGATNQQEKEPSTPSELKVLQESMLKMQKTLDTMTRRDRPANNRPDKNQPQAGIKNHGQKSGLTQGQQQYRRTCWTCGSEKHIRINCPQTEKKSETEDKDQQMKQVASCGAGLYVKCKVNRVPVESLVDTGATLTIISTRLWETIQQCSSPLLENFSTQVFTASGEPVEIKGKTTVFIDIGGMHYTCKVVVADIDLDLIMGLDFFRNHECQIDVVHNVLKIHGISCEMMCSGTVGCYRLSVSEKVHIPAMTEMIIDGKVENSQIHPKGLCIIEPKDQTNGTSELLVARTLCYFNESNPIRVMNITDEDKILYPGTNVATISAVSSVEDVQKVSTSYNKQVPEHLEDLFNRTVMDMDTKQRREVAKLLNKYSDVFKSQTMT